MTTDTVLLRAKIAAAIREVLDPELGVSIVEMGLLYNIFLDDGGVRVEMTLTTMGCPLFSVIEKEVIKQASHAGGLPASVSLTFSPPWSMDMVSPDTKTILGLE